MVSQENFVLSKKTENALTLCADTVMQHYQQRKKTYSVSLRKSIYVCCIFACGSVNGFASTEPVLINQHRSSFKAAHNSLPQEDTFSPRSSLLSQLHMYLPSNSPSSQTQMMIPNKIREAVRSTENVMLQSTKAHSQIMRDGNDQKRGLLRQDSYYPRQQHQRKHNSSLRSMSVVASSDVLPAFRAAHGLLHPHTVMKLKEQHESAGEKNDSMTHFLNTYMEEGPLGCLSFLSDPRVLPDLTRAMSRIDTL